MINKTQNMKYVNPQLVVMSDGQKYLFDTNEEAYWMARVLMRTQGLNGFEIKDVKGGEITDGQKVPFDFPFNEQKWKNKAKEVLGKATFSKLSTREQECVLYHLSFNPKLEVGRRTTDSANERQKTDIKIEIEERDGIKVMYLDSEYKGTLNGHYFVVDILGMRKLLVDVD